MDKNLAIKILQFLGWLSIGLGLLVGIFTLWPFISLPFNNLNFFPEKKIRQEVKKEMVSQEKIAFDHKKFQLIVPAIGLDSQVLPQVDFNNEESYLKALKVGVAQAKGTAFPGEGRLVYIFGHSTNYEWFVKELNAVFYKLKDLHLEDQIIVNQNDKEIVYQVVDKKVVEADETSIVSENLDKNILILQTCYPPGTTWRRLLIFARPI